MDYKKTDCEAINFDLVEKIAPIMPDLTELYDLSDFFKVMGDSTRIRLLWALEEADLRIIYTLLSSRALYQGFITSKLFEKTYFFLCLL